MATRAPFPFRIEFPPELPITARADEITAALDANQVLILAGETGSGKTTQIPKMCLAAGRGRLGRIACTQPRRVAALSVSRRVAEELNVTWGREVGCRIRFQDATSDATIVKFLTDGMLLAEVHGDPMLREYDTIIIDEAHERSLNIDFLLGHLRTLRFRRPELKIVITSATIDTVAFSAAFDDAPVLQVEGRMYPVEVIYSPLDRMGSDAADGDEPEMRAEAMHYLDGAVEATERILSESDAGDILVFLPSERDIREAGDLLGGRTGRNCEVVPLFGRLTSAEQQRVFARTQRRKVVLATNIAETSLTIPGIRFVVDTGLARLSRYAPQARTRRLPIEPIAQSSADQRKGRCGRVENGVCIRLYSEEDFLARPRFAVPEIQRANLADVILRLQAFGLGDIERFPFINQPPVKAVRAGYALLEELGAITEAGAATAPAPEATGSRIQKLDTPAAAASTAPRIHEVDTREQAESRSPRANGPETSRIQNSDTASGGATGAIAPARIHKPDTSAAPAPGRVRTLTPVGEDLARLPVDPTVGRMILQARNERALREVLVIAAGLSVQDPRERPLDRQAQADQAHRRFVHPDSDFLTLLQIWEAYHDEVDGLTQAKLRRFCQAHFLSYTRMREWRDIHSQLVDTLRSGDDFPDTSAFRGVTSEDARAARFSTPPYRAIHRSILAGLLGNIAHRDEETGEYKATHDRRVIIFPGSALRVREERPPPRGAAPAAKRSKPSIPRWIMAAEIMETTRLFARTCARLEPAWALELGSHLVRISHSEPFWDEAGGRVLVKQRTRLYGLELETRAVSYGRIRPRDATDIFIREGLVNDTVVFPLDFILANRQLREQIEHELTRARDAGFLNLDEAAYRFYAARLLPTAEDEAAAREAGQRGEVPQIGVSSVGELVDLVRERRPHEPDFLVMRADDLRDPTVEAPPAEDFPVELPLQNRALPLNYAYKPGQPDDGVTVEVPVSEAETLTAAALDWAVPGHLVDKVEFYIKALPKETRRLFVPVAEKARELAGALAERRRVGGRAEPLVESLAAEMRSRFHVAVDPEIWRERPLPDYWRVRVRVVDEAGNEIVATRDFSEIEAALERHRRALTARVVRDEPETWQRARAKWERPPQTAWTFGDIPARVTVAEQAGVDVEAFPGLYTMRDGVALRLYHEPGDARRVTEDGLRALLDRALGNDLGWLERDLRAIRELGPLLSTLAPVAELQAQAFASIRRWITDPMRVRRDATGWREQDFRAAVEVARAELKGIVPRFVALLRDILSARQSLLVHPTPYPGAAEELAALLPPDFLRVTPYPQLAHFPRYLRAMNLRADRWRQNPAKDAERAAQWRQYINAAARVADVAVRWLVQEFYVSLFAQELGTSEPVSAVKLDRALAAVGATREPPPANGKPASPPPTPGPIAGEKKPTRLKTLGALGNAFPRS